MIAIPVVAAALLAHYGPPLLAAAKAVGPAVVRNFLPNLRTMVAGPDYAQVAENLKATLEVAGTLDEDRQRKERESERVGHRVTARPQWTSFGEMDFG